MPNKQEFIKNKEFISYCGKLMNHIRSWEENGVVPEGKTDEELLIHEDSIELVKILSKSYYEGDYDFKGFS